MKELIDTLDTAMQRLEAMEYTDNRMVDLPMSDWKLILFYLKDEYSMMDVVENINKQLKEQE